MSLDWPHQQYSTGFFQRTPVGFDFSSPGTGKTRVQLRVYAARHAPGRCLVLCPKTLTRSAWGSEIRSQFPSLTYSVATADNRLEAFKINTDIVITNYDAVRDLSKSKDFLKILKDFDHLIVDESTAFKNPSAQRSKAAAKLAKLFERKYLLTGTPTPNSVTELWHPTFMLDGGARLGSSYFKFRNVMQYAQQVGPMPQHVKWIDRPGAEEAVFDLLHDIMVRHAFEDVMSHVPPNHVARYTFELPKKLQKQYLELETTSVLELETTIMAAQASAVRNKLLQLASGALYDGTGNYVVLDDTRYELIFDLVDQYDHSVVFFNWKHQREELMKLFEARGVAAGAIDGSTPDSERLEIVDLFQEGHLKTVLLHPRTGAHGLTLTRGQACIIASPIYEADLLQQAVHRIYRGGQKYATNTILVEAENTVEGQVYQRLNDKKARMDDFLALVKQRRA